LKASSKEARRGASGGRASTPGKGGSSTEEDTSESENDEAAAAAAAEAAAAADATWRAECEAMDQQEATAAVGRAARLEVTHERAWEPGGKGRVRCVFSFFSFFVK
jgi:hypothetical protein